jgi:hypothetical protein
VSVDDYLRELRRLLPSTRRERFLRESEAHLRETVDRLTRDGVARREAEARAVEAFGPAAEVAARMRRETAPIAVRRAGGVAVVALASLVAPLYAVPENLLPPAPWPERPAYLGTLLTVALACWLGALVAAASGWALPPRGGARALGLACLLGLASGAASVAAAMAWHVEAPATPWHVTMLVVLSTLLALAAVSAAAAWAHTRARSLA